MQLIKFNGTHGFVFFVNPKHITFVSQVVGENTTITFADEQNFIEIPQPISEVIQKLSKSKKNS